MSVVKGMGVLRLEPSQFSLPLRPIDPIEREGLRLRLSHGLKTVRGIHGYAFEVFEGDETIGSATILVTNDLAEVRETGHLGCEIRSEKRKQGYPVRVARALFPLFEEHGLRELLCTCDVGHESLYRAIEEVGGVFLDELPAASPDEKRRARFVISISRAA